MKKIGFIGIGAMGSSMVKHLLKKGYEVTVYTRTKDKADEVIGLGAIWGNNIKECVSNADVVITIVGYPKDVEEVYFGENGIIENVEELRDYIVERDKSRELRHGYFNFSPNESYDVILEALRTN